MTVHGRPLHLVSPEDLPLSKLGDMSDTLPATERYLDDRYRRLTPGQRVEMACGMFSAAVELARAGILAAEPQLGRREIRVRLLRGLYADDLPRNVLDALSARL